MSVTDISTARDTARTRGKRTEKHVAAEVVASLLHGGVISKDAQHIAAASRAIGISVKDIENAYLEARDGYRWRATEEPIADQPPPRKMRRKKVVERPMADPDASECGKERLCPRCDQWLPATTAFFYPRDRRSGELCSYCIACRRGYSAERVLTVRKADELSRVGLTFIVDPEDGLAGLACATCGKPIKDGDEVHGLADLSHSDCADADAAS